MMETVPRPTPVTFSDALAVWWRVGLHSFGGPAGQIATMHRILVQEKRWIGEPRFLHALNYCMLLPGPEAQQLAIYIGWLLHGTRGGLVAGSLFVLPGAAVMLALSMLYTGLHGLGLVAAVFFGLKAAVLAVVLEAVARIGRRVLKTAALVSIAALAFVGIFFFQVPFPLIVLGAGIAGGLGGWIGSGLSPDHQRQGGASGDGRPVVDALLDEGALAHTRPRLARALQVAAAGLALWFAPIAVVAALRGSHHVFVQESLFFSKVAVVTFGGAYAVLAYVAQQAVELRGWLQPGEMLDGLGMAETTPGPLILVLQFVGFVAAYRNPGELAPMLAGVLGAALTVWVTFVPCFLWVFLGAPYIESLRGNRRLVATLEAITAAVVGVILNLAIWFALHVLFTELETLHGPLGLRLLVPAPATLDVPALCIAAGAFAATFWLKAKMLPTLGAATAAGLVYYLVFRR